MDEALSIHEIRRRAPLHYWAKANNARYVAYLLSQATTENFRQKASDKSGYGGSPNIAVNEGFSREAAIALELIIKAVIARRIERGCAPAHVKRVRMTHDLTGLWQDAMLPPLPPSDKYILFHVKRVLYWAGRYAAPTSDDVFEKEQKEEERLISTKTKNNLTITPATNFDWNNFDRIYQIAHYELSQLMGWEHERAKN